MAGVKEHLKSAEEFYEAGLREYNEGKRSGDLMKMREGCEKVFHAYIESSSALVQKRGLPEPEDHASMYEILYKLGEREILDVGKDAFFYLHRLAYYGYKVLPEVEVVFKQVREAMRSVPKK